jgi:hypothetical protein
LVDSHQSSFAIIDRTEFVHITRGHSSTGLYRSHHAILFIHDDTMTTTITLLLIPLEEAQMIGAIVLAHVEAVCITGP